MTPSTENSHWARLEDGDPTCSVCSCGWRSEPMPPEDAVEAGLVHTAAADTNSGRDVVSATRATLTLTYQHVPRTGRRGGGATGWMPAKVNGFDRVKAFDGTRLVGFMDLHGDYDLARNPPGRIAWIEVLPKYRRRGVATGMLRYAEALGLHPTHSPALSESERTRR